jgi:sugar phosphate isomerase/epimerase
MKVGYQTIPWGRALGDGGREMIETIREAGYAGVEIAQHPEQFGSAKALYELLRDYDNPDVEHRKELKLLGLAGGAISERIAFIDQLVDAENRDLLARKGKIDRVIGNKRPYPYVYTDMWDNSGVTDATTKRWTFALHPHMFKPIQTASEALKVLREHPELRFLPDAAHLTIAGEDVIDVLKAAFEIQTREEDSDQNAPNRFGPIIAIHLKDWTSEFGRSYQFYSRGFGVAFGQGEVKLDKIARFLVERGYNGWVVVEQDVVDDLVTAARGCRRWLQDKRI